MMLITAAQIGLHSKPIVLLRDRYFIPVTEALEEAVADGFASWEDLRLVHVFPGVPAVAQALADWRDGLPGSPLTCAVAANDARGYELRQLVSSLTKEYTGF
jgi:predicted Rossmann-fold nucleotide-binding protein